MNQNGKPLAEITVKAVGLGIILSMVLAAANAYLGLFAGMTVSASIPAAVMSMGILRLWKQHNILENNIVQTAASAGESLAAGVIFTLPALVIMGYWTEFNYKWVTIIAGFGGLLGILFTIPLRRALIVESKLKFPEGIATAEVLESGQRGGSDVFFIVKSAIASGLFKLGAGSGLGLWPDTVQVAARIKGSVAYAGTNLSPALLAVGYIVGLNIALLMFIGGMVNWLIVIPITAGLQEWPLYPADHRLAGQVMSALDHAGGLWSEKTRFLGVGAMLVGGLWTIIGLRSSLLSGVRSGLKAYRKVGGGQETVDRTDRDIPMAWVLVALIASVVPLYLVYQAFVAKVAVALAMAVIMLIAGFLFSAVAGYMAGVVGSSNNPISGVTIATVTISALLLLVLLGKDDPNGPPAAIVIGGVVCCAAAIAGDNMQDLKAGFILKATPWKQQVMQIVGVVAAALVIAPILSLLLNAYGFEGQPSKPPEVSSVQVETIGGTDPNLAEAIAKAEVGGAAKKPLGAPQANLMASVARGVFNGELPWWFVGIGALMGVAVIILDVYLMKSGSSFRTPVLAVAIGIYLPLELEVPILAGGLIHFGLQRYHARRRTPEQQSQESSRHGLLFASGLITGEALLGIMLAVPIVIFKDGDVMAIFKDPSSLVNMIGAIVGSILLISVGSWLYRIGMGSKARA